MPTFKSLLGNDQLEKLEGLDLPEASDEFKKTFEESLEYALDLAEFSQLAMQLSPIVSSYVLEKILSSLPTGKLILPKNVVGVGEMEARKSKDSLRIGVHVSFYSGQRYSGLRGVYPGSRKDGLYIANGIAGMPSIGFDPVPFHLKLSERPKLSSLEKHVEFPGCQFYVSHVTRASYSGTAPQDLLRQVYENFQRKH